MTGQHTPGRISFSAVDHAPVLHLYAEDDKHLFHGVRSLEEQQANAARIVLTWNCHDDLLAALRECLELIDVITPIEGHTVRKARAALAKAVSQ